MPCSCYESTSMLDKPWIHVLTPKQKPCYLPVTNCSYWSVLGSFNNWNIITLSHKSTTSEDFKGIHQVVLDGISENMASLVQSAKHEAINTAYTSSMGYYVIKFVSEAYTLQDDTTCDRTIVSAVELFFNRQYLSCMQ